MRERAENALHQVLTLAGEKCGFEAQATACGLYAPTEVEEIIERYEAGDTPFSTVTDIIFERADRVQYNERILF